MDINYFLDKLYNNKNNEKTFNNLITYVSKYLLIVDFEKKYRRII